MEVGKFGLPALGLWGSAVASVIQYGSMLFMALLYIGWNPDYRQYGMSLFHKRPERKDIKQAISMGWPLMVDKAVLAGAYVWLGKMICPIKGNWKDKTPTKNYPITRAGPLRLHADQFVLREFCCPACATLLDTDVVLEGEPSLYDEISY